MSHFDHGCVEIHNYPSINEIKDRIKVLINIGELSEKLNSAVEENENSVHIASDYKVLVPQGILREGISLDKLIDIIRNRVTQKL